MTPQRGAVAGRRQRAGIAMGQDGTRGGHQCLSKPAHPFVAFDVLIHDRKGFLDKTFAYRTDIPALGDETLEQARHSIDRPEQIDPR